MPGEAAPHDDDHRADDDHRYAPKPLDFAGAVIEHRHAEHHSRADDVDANRALDRGVLAVFRSDDRINTVELAIEYAAVRYYRHTQDYVVCYDARTGEHRHHSLSHPGPGSDGQ